MRIAIIAHVYYPALWSELARAIRNFSEYGPDELITVSQSAGDAIVAQIRADMPKAKVFVVENRGYDVGPFFYVLHQINLADYDYIVKLHTKRNRVGFVNYLPLIGGSWRRKLLGFCSTPTRVKSSLSVLETDPSVGMVAHGELIMNTDDEMDRLLPSAKKDHFNFVAGTMFLVRAKLLEPLKAEIAFKDFPVMSGRAFGFAHACERRFGKVVHNAAKRLAAIPPRGLAFRLAFLLARFLYRVFMRRECNRSPSLQEADIK